MIPIKRADVVFVIVHILCLTDNVRGEEEEREEYSSYHEEMTLEFPYDINSSNTSATAVFGAEEDIADLTLCFAFRVDALKNVIRDEIQLIRLEDSYGETQDEILLTIHKSSTFWSGTKGGESFVFGGPRMALMTWMRTCISDYNNGSDSNNGSVILVMNGAKLGEQPLFDFDANVTSKGNFTLHLGKHLMGSMTDVNLFSPALTEEDMKNITNPEGEECGKEGSIFSWRDSLSKTGDKDTEQTRLTYNCAHLRLTKESPFLIFVIFFTRAKFLENKIYTEKTRKLRQNTQ